MLLTLIGSGAAWLIAKGKQDARSERQGQDIALHAERLGALEGRMSKLDVLDERTTRMAVDIREIRDTLRDAQR
jgi:hypothetical protein